MQVILSHDVDHMTVWEHWKDPILPKYYVRNTLELSMGVISWKEYGLRWADLWRNQWQRIEEVMAFHEHLGIRSCFFFGMANGKGLSYAQDLAERWIPHVLARGFEAGVHGIAFNNEADMRQEHADFQRISGRSDFGIRMHYLRQDAHTFERMERIGYRFDATAQGMIAPHRIGRMWEFPLQEMDGWAMDGSKRYQSRDLKGALAHTLAKVQEAERAGLPYFNLLFHDRYYTPAFATWMAWYETLVKELKQRGHGFTTHAEAIAHLERTA